MRKSKGGEEIAGAKEEGGQEGKLVGAEMVTNVAKDRDTEDRGCK